MKILYLLAVTLGVGTGLLTEAIAQSDPAHWPSWRGPNGTGSVVAADPPIEWSETKNIAWKVALPGRGISSPVVWGDRIYLTTAVETTREGTAGDDLAPQNRLAEPRPTVLFEFRVLAVDRHTGRALWNRKVAEAVPHEGGHRTNSHASNSPVTDGTHVYANFGSRGVYCLTIAGDVVWSRTFGRMTTRRQYGEASSPALFGDDLVINWDHEGDSFIVVLDKRTGKTRWRKARDEVTSWSTPIVTVVDERPQIVINATTASRGYDLATGDVVWSARGMTVNCIPHPIVSDGLVYLMSGYRGNLLQAVKLAGARGDVTDTDHVVWSHDRDTSYVPSAVLHRGLFYFVRKNMGVLACLDARTGAIQYDRQRLTGLRSIYASPVGAADRIYITSRDGKTQVIRHGSTFNVLATNQLDDAIDASAALVGDTIYMRGHRHLYCIRTTADGRN